MAWLVEQLQDWGYIALFLLTFLETSALLGLLVPGETVVVIAGFLAWQGVFSLADVLWVAGAGAALGDSTGYALGRYFGDAVFRFGRSFFLREEYLARTRAFIDRYGGKTIFFGRFVGWFRSFGPFVAGAGRLPYPRFLFFDLYGAALWTAVFALLGYFAGNSWTLIKSALGEIGVALAALAAVIGFAYLFLHKRRRLIGHQIGRFDRMMTARLPVVWDFLKDRFHPRAWYGLSLTFGIVVFVLALWAVAGIVESVIHRERLYEIDLRARDLVEGLLSPTITRPLVLLVNFAALYALVLTGLAIVVYLVRMDDALRLAGFIVAVILGELVLVLLRVVFRGMDLPNFPSGYAYSAMLVYGFLAHLAWVRLRGEIARFVAYSVAAGLTLLIGFGQLYLNVHWLTDVLAGYAAAFAWLVFGIVLTTTLAETGRADLEPAGTK